MAKTPIYRQPGEGRKEYHIVTPEGDEILLGYFKTRAAAKRLYNRIFPADWRGLSNLIQSDVPLTPKEKSS